MRIGVQAIGLRSLKATLLLSGLYVIALLEQKSNLVNCSEAMIAV